MGFIDAFSAILESAATFGEYMYGQRLDIIFRESFGFFHNIYKDVSGSY
jgi:hypothetical protein